MIYEREETCREAALQTAKKMIAAAVTAPKACGIDNVEACVIDGKDQEELLMQMRKMASETGISSYAAHADMMTGSDCIVLIGVRTNPVNLSSCGLCGLKNCAKMRDAGANCAFNMVDLGIAIGSAVSLAADCRIDNRIITFAGKPALKMGLFSKDVRVCFGIPLSVSAKNIFFDRDDIDFDT